MESYQWFLLGAMAAWTPGLIILAVALHNAPDETALWPADERESTSTLADRRAAPDR
jgi:hypothetical protein